MACTPVKYYSFPLEGFRSGQDHAAKHALLPPARRDTVIFLPLGGGGSRWGEGEGSLPVSALQVSP